MTKQELVCGIKVILSLALPHDNHARDRRHMSSQLSTVRSGTCLMHLLLNTQRQ